MSLATVVMVNSGWIVNGLIIYQPRGEIIWGGGEGGTSKAFILDKDEQIETIEGENSYFDGNDCTGKISIRTNKRVIGPFGHSGDPAGGSRHIVRGAFRTTLKHFRLRNRWSWYLEPIYPRNHQLSN